MARPSEDQRSGRVACGGMRLPGFRPRLRGVGGEGRLWGMLPQAVVPVVTILASLVGEFWEILSWRPIRDRAIHR